MSIQEIGIVIDLSLGTFSNTIYKDNKLQLIQLGEDGDGNPVYADAGFWESTPIMIQDKIRAFKNLVRTMAITGGATYKAYTRISEDGFTWGNYVEVSADGTINNPPAKFAMIKLEIFADKKLANFYADRFNKVGKYDNYLINSESGLLELKKDYVYSMDSGGSKIHKSETVVKSDFKKIDKIRVNKI